MEYEVTAVASEVRDWSSQKGGKMKSYRIDVKGPDGAERKNIELAQKETTAAPVVGQKLDGEIKERTYGEPPKTDYKFQKAVGAGGGGGGRAWKPRPDDVPEVYASRQAGIIRQHSQNMALRVLELSASRGTDPETIMQELGVPTANDATPPVPYSGLVEAFGMDVSRRAAEAWKGEAEKHGIADALAKVSG